MAHLGLKGRRSLHLRLPLLRLGDLFGGFAFARCDFEPSLGKIEQCYPVRLCLSFAGQAVITRQRWAWDALPSHEREYDPSTGPDQVSFGLNPLGLLNLIFLRAL